VASEVPGCHLYHIVLVKKVTKTQPDSEGGILDFCSQVDGYQEFAPTFTTHSAVSWNTWEISEMFLICFFFFRFWNICVCIWDILWMGLQSHKNLFVPYTPYPHKLKVISYKNFSEVEHQWLTPIILGTWETEIRKIDGWGLPGKSSWDPISKNNQNKMEWRCGSNSRAPALKAWSYEFKHQSYIKKKKRILVSLNFTSDLSHKVKCGNFLLVESYWQSRNFDFGALWIFRFEMLNLKHSTKLVIGWFENNKESRAQWLMPAILAT
jgi:hypothetical protein